jgi:hypothetical protein
MSVRFEHPDYRDNIDKWIRCRTVAAGQDAVHSAGAVYLPRLLDQSEAEYEAYLGRTPFYNATWRTIVGLQGMLFRKPPSVVLPPVVEPMKDNITLDGTPLHIFALELAEECLKIGRVGVFVDYPMVDTETSTKADAQAKNLRPLLKMYHAESITNWKTRTVNNATVLSLVVLKECVEVALDEFESEEQEQYRVLDLFDLAGVVTPVYRARVIVVKKDEAGKDVETVISTIFPRIDGQCLDTIPFQFIGVDDVNWKVDEPPLIDLVDMNLMHYRVSADYEHGCHFTGLPTPVIVGYTPEKEGEKFHIGSTTAWVFPRPEASASYLEFTGEGLTSLERNLEKKEKQMAILGARMLETQNAHVESADTAAIHRGGEQSMLASVGQSISIGVTKALQLFARFASADPTTVKFELNRDFFPVPMDSLKITALIAAWQNQAISYPTMFDNLQKGEIVALDATAESEQSAIKANPPPIPVQAGATPGNIETKSASASASGTGKNPTQTQMQN